MTQAANGVTPLLPLPQSPIDGDMLARLKGIWGLMSSLTHSCLDLGGWELQEALGFLAEEFGECIEQIEPRVERLERLRRRALRR